MKFIECSCKVLQVDLDDSRCIGEVLAELSYDGIYRRVERTKEQNMTEAEDLFAKFYNDEKILVSDMDSLTFRAREEELAKIAHEARARLTAMSDVKREKTAKLKTSQKEWLIESGDVDSALVSDAINTIAARKKRLNKAEKLQEQLKALGLDNDVVKVMMTNVERKNTESTIQNISFAKKVEETKAELTETKVDESQAKPAEPFDVTQLKFK